MDDHRQTRQLAGEGRFAEALESLSRAGGPSSARNALDVLRADLLERTGAHQPSRLLLQDILRRRNLSLAERSQCGLILSRLDWNEGDISAAIAHLQRAIADARQARDSTRVCLAQIRLMALLADRSGPEATVALLSEVRRSVVLLGDPHVTATLHLTVAEAEGKRGLLDSSLRHTRVAQDILRSAPNVWLESWSELTLQALFLLRGDYQLALAHGLRALARADESGAASTRKAVLGNLGNLYFELGDLPKAIDYIEAADACLASTGTHRHAGLESRARIRLVQGRLQESAALLDTLEAALSEGGDQRPYVFRHTALTRARQLLAQGRTAAAAAAAAKAAALARDCGDTLLWTSATMLAARALDAPQSCHQALSSLEQAAASLRDLPLSLHRDYEETLAALCEAHAAPDEAAQHRRRAARIGLALDRGSVDARGAERRATPVAASSSNVVQDLALALLHPDRPELVATSLAAALTSAGLSISAAAIRRREDGEELLAGNVLPAPAPDVRRTTLVISEDAGIELNLQYPASVETVACVSAVSVLASIAGELHDARHEREQRIALWPLDDDAVSDGADRPIFAGRMGQLLSLARRVARTHAAVLITGESGTGKEILAREIHRHSPRAARPFVPFNCTAVPPDMLESHLFGHRRGAFTGAERDNPGLIRAAHGGTLFLDEVGDMNPALQPKLLRFLESGEIQPLGEVSPVAVDVRIVAATNANLEALVHAGRFRDDLYYRLNVVRLNIPPLRERRDEIPALVHQFAGRAAEEFGKGRIRIAEDTMELMLLYAWPGNIRQLQNELRRMIALADSDARLTPASLCDDIRGHRQGGAVRPGLALAAGDKLAPTLRRLEREMIRAALDSHRGRVDAAARALGISRKGLYLKRQRLGL